MKAAAFVGVLLAVSASGALPAQTTYGKWVSGQSMDGREAVSTSATEGGRAMLEVLCQPDGPGVRIRLGKSVGNVSDSSLRIRLKFNDAAGESPAGWAHQYSPNSSLLTMARSRVDRFVRHAKRAAELSVQITDPLEVAPLELVFSLDGAADALAALACTKDL